MLNGHPPPPVFLQESLDLPENKGVEFCGVPKSPQEYENKGDREKVEIGSLDMARIFDRRFKTESWSRGTARRAEKTDCRSYGFGKGEMERPYSFKTWN